MVLLSMAVPFTVTKVFADRVPDKAASTKAEIIWLYFIIFSLLPIQLKYSSGVSALMLKA